MVKEAIGAIAIGTLVLVGCAESGRGTHEVTHFQKSAMIQELAEEWFQGNPYCQNLFSKLATDTRTYEDIYNYNSFCYPLNIKGS